MADASEQDKQRRGCQILDWSHEEASSMLMKVGSKAAPAFLVQGRFSNWRTIAASAGTRITKPCYRSARSPMRTISADTYAMSNPALTSILLWQFASPTRSQGSAPALPLAFIVLPIAMSRPAMDSFTGTNKTTGFLTCSAASLS